MYRKTHRLEIWQYILQKEDKFQIVKNKKVAKFKQNSLYFEIPFNLT